MRNGMRRLCRPCLEAPNACVFFVVSTKTVAGPVRIPSAGNSNSRCEICSAHMHMPPTRSPGTPLFEWCPFLKCNRRMMTNQAPSSDHCRNPLSGINTEAESSVVPFKDHCSKRRHMKHECACVLPDWELLNLRMSQGLRKPSRRQRGGGEALL